MAMAECRIHCGSPAKVRTPKRVFDVAMRENAPVYRAKRVLCEEPLKSGEVYITHRRVLDDWDCGKALAFLGVPPAVLVSEAVEKLGEEVTPVFQSLSGLSQYRGDVQIIVGNIKSAQGRGSFSRFAHGIYIGLKDGDKSVRDAIRRSGFELFREVIKAVAEDFKDNKVLQWMATDDDEAKLAGLMAWNQAFELSEVCHSFNFIGGDVTLAEEAVQVLSYLGQTKKEEYQDLVYLIQAAVPLVQSKVDEKKVMAAKVKIAEEKNREDIRKKLLNL